MNRILRIVVASVFALLASTASQAWDVNWSNHRSITVTVYNLYTEELRILGYDYQCVNHKPEPVNIAPNGEKGTVRFEWKACDGKAWEATLALGIRGQGTQVCIITLGTSIPDTIDNKVSHFQAATNHSTNCKIEISADPNDPRDNLTVLVKSTAVPREPVPRPSSKPWRSGQCEVVANYAPDCATDRGGEGLPGESCVFSDCRACPQKGAKLEGYYIFKFGFLQSDANSNLQVDSCN